MAEWLPLSRFMECDLGHDGSLRASVGKRSPEYSTRSPFLAAMGSTCEQGKPNGNQKTNGGYRIGQKTIQKAKSHPADGRCFGSLLSYSKGKVATYFTNNKKGSEIGNR